MLQQCYMELLKQKEGGNRMNHYEAINDVLVNLFNEILDLEERALITGEYKNISVPAMPSFSVTFSGGTISTISGFSSKIVRILPHAAAA